MMLIHPLDFITLALVGFVLVYCFDNWDTEQGFRQMLARPLLLALTALFIVILVRTREL